MGVCTKLTLDLQPGLHANDSSLCEEYTFGIRTLLFAFLFLSKIVALRSMLVVSTTFFLTLQLPASVSWRCGVLCDAWHCWLHWNLFLFFSGILNGGVKIFNFVEWHEVSFEVQLVLLGFPYSIAVSLSFDHVSTRTSTLLAKSFLVSM